MCQILFKLVFISHCYHKSPRGELFFETQCSLKFADKQTDRQTADRYRTLEQHLADTIPNIKTLPATSTSWHGRYKKLRIMLYSRQQLEKRENGGTVERCQKSLLQLKSNDDNNNDEK